MYNNHCIVITVRGEAKYHDLPAGKEINYNWSAPHSQITMSAISKFKNSFFLKLRKAICHASKKSVVTITHEENISISKYILIDGIKHEQTIG